MSKGIRSCENALMSSGNVQGCAILLLNPLLSMRKILFPLFAFFTAKVKYSESKESWKPVKGDGKPGSMPGLSYPLGSFEWYPDECRRKIEVVGEEPGRRKLLSSHRNKKRVPGWKQGMFHDAELVLDSWLNLLNFNGTCAFEVRDCCSPGSKRFRRVSHKHAGVVFHYVETVDSELACKSQISIPKGSWGSCVFIASGSTLLRRTQGKFIDEHDTIIRLGHMPLDGWEKYTGSRTDILIGRGTIQSNFALGKETKLRFVIGKDSTPNFQSVDRVRFSDSTLIKPTLNKHNPQLKLILGDPSISDILYEISTKPLGGKRRGQTTGFSHILRIILSQFCEEIDVFGMSPNCGGHYYNLKSVMKNHHSCELESWALHYIMKNAYENTKMCLFV